MMNSLLKTTFTIFLVLIVGTGCLHAQKKEVSYPKYIISTKPSLLFDGEYKLSFEKQLHSDRQWIGVGISGFFLPEKTRETWETRNTIDYNSYLKSLKGAGLDLTYKYYFIPGVMYAGGDLFYGYYQTKYDGQTIHKYEEDGLTFYEYGFGKVNKYFNRTAGNIYLGVGIPIYNKVFFDTYMGIGYTHSFYNDEIPMFDSIFGFGYKGLYPVLGLRLGVTLGK